jgi:LAS superfamily LD-carboxypeptidase LdcB
MFYLLVIALGALVLLMPRTALAYIDGQPVEIQLKDIGRGACLRSDAADAFNGMAVACMEGTGIELHPSGPRAGFRTSEQQQQLRAELGGYGDGAGGLAAAVNKSPHQKGTAVDIEGLDPAKENFDSSLRGWMDENAGSYGFVNTGAAYVTTRELWHWEYIL